MSGKKSQIFAVKDIDHKGRLVIPYKIRQHTRYLIYADGDKIILEGTKKYPARNDKGDL